MTALSYKQNLLLYVRPESEWLCNQFLYEQLQELMTLKFTNGFKLWKLIEDLFLTGHEGSNMLREWIQYVDLSMQCWRWEDFESCKRDQTEFDLQNRLDYIIGLWDSKKWWCLLSEMNFKWSCFWTQARTFKQHCEEIWIRKACVWSDSQWKTCQWSGIRFLEWEEIHVWAC